MEVFKHSNAKNYKTQYRADYKAKEAFISNIIAKAEGKLIITKNVIATEDHFLIPHPQKFNLYEKIEYSRIIKSISPSKQQELKTKSISKYQGLNYFENFSYQVLDERESGKIVRQTSSSEGGLINSNDDGIKSINAVHFDIVDPEDITKTKLAPKDSNETVSTNLSKDTVSPQNSNFSAVSGNLPVYTELIIIYLSHPKNKIPHALDLNKLVKLGSDTKKSKKFTLDDKKSVLKILKIKINVHESVKDKLVLENYPPPYHLNYRQPKIFKLLNFVCPASGKGHGELYFNNFIFPILLLIDSIDVIATTITKYANHAKNAVIDYFRVPNCIKPDFILIVSGDGLIHEIVNGLMSCGQGNNNIPLFPFPAGGGNGINASRLFGMLPAVEQAAAKTHLIKQPATKTMHHLIQTLMNMTPVNPEKFDLVQVKSNNLPPIYSCLSTTWGHMGDLDYESNKLRFLGEFRFDVMAFWRIIFLRKYYAKIKINEMTREGYFASLIGFYPSHAGATFCFNKNSFYARHNSIKLFLADSNVKKLDMLLNLIKLEDTGVLKEPGVVYETSNFSLEILPDPKTKKLKPGNLMIDGEKIETNQIFVELCADKLLIV